MPVQKVSFESSILSGMAAKAASYQDTQQPESKQVEAEPQKEVQPPVNQDSEKPKSHKTRNTIIGLGAAAILIALGVAGRKGKLGPKLQEFLGGTEKVAKKNNAGSVNPHTEPPHADTHQAKTPQPETAKAGTSSHESTPHSEATYTEQPAQKAKPAVQKEEVLDTKDIQAAIAKLDKNTQEEIARINQQIDQRIPHIDESLKTIKIPTEEEIMQIIRKEIDIDSIELSQCVRKASGNYEYQERIGEYTFKLTFNSNKKLLEFRKLFNTDAEKIAMEVRFDDFTTDFYDFKNAESLHVYLNKDSKKTYAATNISEQANAFYREDGTLDFIKQRAPGGWDCSCVRYTNSGDIKNIEYKSNTGELLKEVNIEKGTVTKEVYKINGNEVTVAA